MSICHDCNLDKPEGEWQAYRVCSRYRGDPGKYFVCTGCLKKRGARPKKPFKSISIPIPPQPPQRPIYKCEVIDADTKEHLVTGFEEDMKHAKIGSTVEVVRPLGTPAREYRVVNIDRRDDDKPMTLYVVKK